jgi:ankyrin repeat protein
VFRCLAYGGEIHDAARAGDAERVDALLKSYPSVVNSKMKGGITPLHEAVFRGHESVIKVLLAHKVDVNEGDIGGTTPLHQTLLSVTENPAIAELLLANGAVRMLRMTVVRRRCIGLPFSVGPE